MEKQYYCYICKEHKVAEEFYKDRGRNSGVTSRCKKCHKPKAEAIRKIATLNTEEAIIAYKEVQERRRLRELRTLAAKRKDPNYRLAESKWQKRYRQEKLPKYLLKSAKQRAIESKLPFNLDIEDIQIPENCPLLGVKMELRTKYAPSIDKIIPDKGYVKGNIMIISRKANTMKNDASIEQLRVFARNVLRLYK